MSNNAFLKTIFFETIQYSIITIGKKIAKSNELKSN